MTKLSVGITGQSGFIGSHLSRALGMNEGVRLIPFDDEDYASDERLSAFAGSCDCIVHLAAMNRGDALKLYDTNVALVRSLIRAVRSTGRKPHIIFASSTQESRDTPYGHSKQEGRRLLEEWARSGGGAVTSLLIPNVFGPFGRPFHNSVVGTFCFQLTHGQTPEIHADAALPLLPVGALAEQIAARAVQGSTSTVEVIAVPPLAVRRVSEILRELQRFRDLYLDGGVIPALASEFDTALFTTFHSYVESDFYPKALDLRVDGRGCLAELVRSQHCGQAYMSRTRPSIVRGNHFHTRKIERFVVLAGEATVRWRRVGTAERVEFALSGETPAYVDIPVFHTHHIENTGAGDLLTIFWSTELFNGDDPDTIPEQV